jgi:hypothetical protein
VTVELRIRPWRFLWEGGRLMDVFHDHVDGAVDSIQAGPYDWQTDRSQATEETVLENADEWIRECAQTYLRNVVQYRTEGR